ncbi:hypothetical protein A3Q56_00845 [Intoshia linei]|uniref:Uncharacterized protein n=1 Tax=Intoshia linei TaxID=1819745 RepID=A0A177BCJ2_9BILA|nr:hypothetical protein A3Q56_00845 [Intoshia linei]
MPSPTKDDAINKDYQDNSDDKTGLKDKVNEMKQKVDEMKEKVNEIKEQISNFYLQESFHSDDDFIHINRITPDFNVNKNNEGLTTSNEKVEKSEKDKSCMDNTNKMLNLRDVGPIDNNFVFIDHILNNNPKDMQNNVKIRYDEQIKMDEVRKDDGIRKYEIKLLNSEKTDSMENCTVKKIGGKKSKKKKKTAKPNLQLMYIDKNGQYVTLDPKTTGKKIRDQMTLDLEKSKLENERIENEKIEKIRIEKEKKEKEIERIKTEKIEMEKWRIEQEKIKMEKIEKKRIKNEKLKKEKIEKYEKSEKLKFENETAMLETEKKIENDKVNKMENKEKVDKGNEHIYVIESNIETENIESNQLTEMLVEEAVKKLNFFDLMQMINKISYSDKLKFLKSIEKSNKILNQENIINVDKKSKGETKIVEKVVRFEESIIEKFEKKFQDSIADPINKSLLYSVHSAVEASNRLHKKKSIDNSKDEEHRSENEMENKTVNNDEKNKNKIKKNGNNSKMQKNKNEILFENSYDLHDNSWKQKNKHKSTKYTKNSPKKTFKNQNIPKSTDSYLQSYKTVQNKNKIVTKGVKDASNESKNEKIEHKMKDDHIRVDQNIVKTQKHSKHTEDQIRTVLRKQPVDVCLKCVAALTVTNKLDFSVVSSCANCTIKLYEDSGYYITLRDYRNILRNVERNATRLFNEECGNEEQIEDVNKPIQEHDCNHKQKRDDSDNDQSGAGGGNYPNRQSHKRGKNYSGGTNGRNIQSDKKKQNGGGNTKSKKYGKTRHGSGGAKCKNLESLKITRNKSEGGHVGNIKSELNQHGGGGVFNEIFQLVKLIGNKNGGKNIQNTKSVKANQSGGVNNENSQFCRVIRNKARGANIRNIKFKIKQSGGEDHGVNNINHKFENVIPIKSGGANVGNIKFDKGKKIRIECVNTKSNNYFYERKNDGNVNHLDQLAQVNGSANFGNIKDNNKIITGGVNVKVKTGETAKKNKLYYGNRKYLHIDDYKDRKNKNGQNTIGGDELRNYRLSQMKKYKIDNSNYGKIPYKKNKLDKRVDHPYYILDSKYNKMDVITNGHTNNEIGNFDVRLENMDRHVNVENIESNKRLKKWIEVVKKVSAKLDEICPKGYISSRNFNNDVEFEKSNVCANQKAPQTLIPPLPANKKHISDNDVAEKEKNVSNCRKLVVYEDVEKNAWYQPETFNQHFNYNYPNNKKKIEKYPFSSINESKLADTLNRKLRQENVVIKRRIRKNNLLLQINNEQNMKGPYKKLINEYKSKHVEKKMLSKNPPLYTTKSNIKGKTELQNLKKIGQNIKNAQYQSHDNVKKSKKKFKTDYVLLKKWQYQQSLKKFYMMSQNLNELVPPYVQYQPVPYIPNNDQVPPQSTIQSFPNNFYNHPIYPINRVDVNYPPYYHPYSPRYNNKIDHYDEISDSNITK